MYFVEKIKREYGKEKVHIFVDMDGVIADYDFGNVSHFDKKRPVLTNIKTFEELSKLSNVSLYILSVCRKNPQIAEKNNWLDQYAPFFKKENRFVLSKEKYVDLASKEIKTAFLKKKIEELKDEAVLVVDDDNGILKYFSKELPTLILFQDSSIVD